MAGRRVFETGTAFDVGTRARRALWVARQGGRGEVRVRIHVRPGVELYSQSPIVGYLVAAPQHDLFLCLRGRRVIPNALVERLEVPDES
jgi:hypothetical protein